MSDQKILRVGLIQNGRIMEERLMRSSQPVTIGHQIKKNTFVVPLSGLPRTYTLFGATRAGYELRFTDQMSGRICLGERIESLRSLIEQGKAAKSSEGFALPIPAHARGKIVLGEVTVLFQFVSAPPRRPRPVLPASMRGGWLRGVEPAMALIVVLSALLQIGFVGWLASKDWPQAHDIDYEYPNHMKLVVLHEDPIVPEAEEVALADNGEGQTDVAEAPVAATPANREEAPEKPTRAEAETRTMAEVRSKTVLGILGTPGGEDGGLLSAVLQGAGQISTEEAFANSTGVEHAMAGQVGGGMKNRGYSGGNVGASAGIGELGSLNGAREAAVDTGKVVEREVTAAPFRFPEPEELDGELDPRAVAAAIKRRQAAIQNCFERELRRNHKAGGRVVINFTIAARGPRGFVSQAKAVVDDVGGGVGACVAKEIKDLRGLPAPKGGDVVINIPFVFQAR